MYMQGKRKAVQASRGIAIPYGKCDAVTKPGLAFITEGAVLPDHTYQMAEPTVMQKSEVNREEKRELQNMQLL